ncbi:MAG: hypothetical protein DELT_02866 [Desulfovibrio sp.]
MQARMKKYPLSESQVHNLLETETVGRLATFGEDGFPYVAPVHFVFVGGKIYIHGLATGEKLRNIAANKHVGFEIERMISLVHDAENPCDTNTEYESVIIRAFASIVEDPAMKTTILDAVVNKYTPQHKGKQFPQNMLKMTGVIELTLQSCTGKYYPGQEG